MVQCLNELPPCVSPMFVCSSGYLVHLLQGGRGWISRSEVVSCSHISNISARTGSVLIRCRPEGICRDAAFRMMVRKIVSIFWHFDGSRLLLTLSSLSLLYRSQCAFLKLKLVRCGMG